MKTKLCVVCGNVATRWSGHAHVDDKHEEEISAGWCDKHEESVIYLTEKPIMIEAGATCWDAETESYFDSGEPIEGYCKQHECYGIYKYDIIEY